MILTPLEQRIEMAYLRSERLGMLCEDRNPTPEQIAIADADAAAWRKEYLERFGVGVQKELL